MAYHKTRIDQLTPTQLDAKGQALLAAGAYKDAIQAYKLLHKRDPQADWQAPLAKAYLGRAKDLAAKRMYKEAALLWENMATLGRPAKEETLYIEWLLYGGQTEKAAAKFTALDTASAGQERLEAVFAALLLAGNQAITQALAVDAALRRQLTLAEDALSSYCQGANTDSVRKRLQAIPFRSPYRDFRLVLNAALKLEESAPEEATQLLTRVAPDSPFAGLAAAVQTCATPGHGRVAALDALTAEQREFAAHLLGFDQNQRSLLKHRLAQPAPANDKALFKFITDHLAVLHKPTAQHACLALLSGYPAGRRHYQQLFGPLTVFDEARAAALRAEQEGNLARATQHWLTCAGLLRQEKTDPDNALGAALLLRHATELTLRARPGARENPPPEVLNNLALSLELDPDDVASHLQLADFHKQAGNRKAYQRWVDQALQRFPDDSAVLLAGIESAKGRKAFKKAADYANKLLRFDPINQQAHALLIDAHLAHARKSIRAGKYHIAEKELTIASQQVRKPNGVIELQRGLLAWCQGEPERAAHWLGQGIAHAGSAIHGALRLWVEAEQLDIEPTVLPGWPAHVTQQSVKHDELLGFAQLVNHYVEEEIPLRLALETLTKPLRRAAASLTEAEDFTTLCECFARAVHYDLLEYYASAALKRWPAKPLFVYYRIYAGAEGIIDQVNDADYDRLERAIEQAHADKDTRTALKIDEFLSQELAIGGPLEGIPPPSPGEIPAVLGELMEMPPKLRKLLLESIINEARARTGEEPPPDILKLLDELANPEDNELFDFPPPGAFPIDFPSPGRRRSSKKPKKKRKSRR